MATQSFQSWNFQVEFESDEYSAAELPLVKVRAQTMPTGCETDFQILCAWFGLSPAEGFGPGNRVIVTLTKKVRGASNTGYSRTNPRMSVNSSIGGTDDSVLSLFVAEMSEILMSVKGEWNRGNSAGEGLSRVCADILHPSSAPRSTNNNVNAWLASDPTKDATSAVADTQFRKDWVSANFDGGPLKAGGNVAGDQDSYSFGCSMLFINYMKDQLGYTEAEIVQSGKPTLAETYTAVTGVPDSGFGPFKRLLDGLFPPTSQAASSDNPFPLLFADHLFTTSDAERTAVTHPKATKLYRLVSLDKGDHLYTSSLAERLQARGFNYRFEGVSAPAFVLPGPAADSVPLYRLLNVQTGEHFCTVNEAEMANAVKNLGFETEGIIGNVFDHQVAESLPLYRLRNAGDNKHFLTTSLAEAQNAVEHLGYVDEGVACYVYGMEGYADEGVACYVMPAPIKGGIALYRLASTVTIDHFYTVSASERAVALSQDGYRDEGIACYVFSDQIAGTIPFFRLYQPRSADHFYTTSASERASAIAQLGYVDEGVTGYVYGAAVKGAVPLFRQYATKMAMM